MQPYVIKQGDFLLKLAHKFDFDADAVWNDPKNKELRGQRPDPNILCPGDILYVPDRIDKPPAWKSLVIGATNSFTSDPPMTTLTIAFVETDDTSYASRAFVVKELPELSGLQTDGNGVATFKVPVTLAAVTLTFSDTGTSYPFSVGAVDPIDTVTGIWQRLQSLGYIGQPRQYDPADISGNLCVLRAALFGLKGVQQPSSDDAGLSDDGTLDADTRKLLLEAYGC